MCGIAGHLQVDRAIGDRDLARDAFGKVEWMVAMQGDRGPDHAAVIQIDHPLARVTLGHTRLSVLDLSLDAIQPMQSHDGRHAIVFNGEIYNYLELRAELAALGCRFRTRGDTEVLLAALATWGIEALPRLNGMFAFAFFDRQEATLWLARDRFGVKPLYYVHYGDSLHFASTERPLAAALGLKPNQEWLANAVQYWIFDHDDNAPYHGMRAVRPGHLIEVHLTRSGTQRTNERRYYDLEGRVAETAHVLADRSESSLTENVSELLDDAVRLRMRGDVPVAVSLSGGLDSAAIATIASEQQGGRIKAFCFGHPKASRSEGPLVAKLANHAEIDVHYIWPDDKTLADGFRRTLEAQDSPIVNTSLVAQNILFQTARQNGFKVMLGGQGGDEVFLGYRKYQAFVLQEAVRQRRPDRALLQMLCLIPTLAAELSLATHYWRHRGRYSARSEIDMVLRLPATEPLRLGCVHGESLASRAIRDVTLASLPSLLRYEDRNSMGNGVESRLPLLDYRLVELGLALPAALKLRRGWGKWILRKTVGDRVPRAIRWARYKRGFSVDQEGWIDRGLGHTIRTMLRRRWTLAQPWLSSSAPLEDLFSDERLKRRGATLAEATALLWLAGHSEPAAISEARSFTLASHVIRTPRCEEAKI